MWSLEKLLQLKKLQIQVRGGNEASMEEACHWGHAVKSIACPQVLPLALLCGCQYSNTFPQPHDSSVMPLSCLGSQGKSCPLRIENPESEPREISSFCSLRQFVTAMEGWPLQPRIPLSLLASGSAGIPWLEHIPFQSLLFHVFSLTGTPATLD